MLLVGRNYAENWNACLPFSYTFENPKKILLSEPSQQRTKVQFKIVECRRLSHHNRTFFFGVSFFFSPRWTQKKITIKLKLLSSELSPSHFWTSSYCIVYESTKMRYTRIYEHISRFPAHPSFHRHGENFGVYMIYEFKMKRELN